MKRYFKAFIYVNMQNLCTVYIFTFLTGIEFQGKYVNMQVHIENKKLFLYIERSIFSETINRAFLHISTLFDLKHLL